jgi:hypothetical protein
MIEKNLIRKILLRTEARRLDTRKIWARSNINVLAKDKLIEAWKDTYIRNTKKFIPTMPNNYMKAKFLSMALKLPHLLEIRLAFA